MVAATMRLLATRTARGASTAATASLTSALRTLRLDDAGDLTVAIYGSAATRGGESVAQSTVAFDLDR